MKRFFAVIFCAAICAALSLSGCADKKNDPARVTFVLDWLPNTNHTGIYVALEKGWYRDRGLEVQIQSPPEDGAVPLVAAGGADFGVSFQEEAIAALTADIPLRIKAVAAIMEHNTSGIVSLKQKGIETPKGMEGHNYATWETPIEQAILKAVIEKDGGDFSKVELIPNTVTDVVSALQTNVDTVWIYYAWDGVALETKGIPTNFFYFADYDAALDFYTPIIIGNERYIAENPEYTRLFLEATRLGYEYAAENPDAAAEILCKYAPETDLEIAKRSQGFLATRYAEDMAKWGSIDAARWDRFNKWAYENGIITREMTSGEGLLEK